MTDSTGAESWIADFTETAAELVAANDAAPVASVRLTDAERESLPVYARDVLVYVAVEQILADRLAPPIPSQRSGVES